LVCCACYDWVLLVVYVWGLLCLGFGGGVLLRGFGLGFGCGGLLYGWVWVFFGGWVCYGGFWAKMGQIWGSENGLKMGVLGWG